MSNKYYKGKYRLSIAGDNKTQNKPIVITDENGNDILDNVGTSYDGLTNQPQVNGVTLKGNKTSADLGLESKTNIVYPSGSSVSMNHNTIYVLASMESLTITVNNGGKVDYISQISFYSPSTPTTLTAPNSIVWYGDGVDSTTGAFVPEAYTEYLVILYSDASFIRGVVQGYYTENPPVIPAPPPQQILDY